MKFKPGDKVFYPPRGFGIISFSERARILEGDHYFVYADFPVHGTAEHREMFLSDGRITLDCAWPSLLTEQEGMSYVKTIYCRKYENGNEETKAHL